MDYRSILVLVAAIVAVNALEHGEGVDNPIIEFFEAPVRAFKTKVAEDVEPSSNFEPEGKSVGIAKVQNNSWFRGKGLANWLMSRNAATTTTTTTPEVVLNTPAESTQQIQTVNNPGNRRRVMKRNNVRRGGGGQGNGNGNGNANWNMRRNSNSNRRRTHRRPVYEDVVYSDEEDYDDFNGAKRYQYSYEAIPYHSASFDEDEEDDEPASFAPLRTHHLRRGHNDHRKNSKPNSSFLQPFQDIPIQARPVRLRQNLPATKPIGNKQQQTTMKPRPGNNPNRNPGNNNNNMNNNNNNNKNKKKKKKNKNKPGNMNQIQHDPVHFIVHPQDNGQLPVLIPVGQGHKKPQKPNVMSDPMDYQNYQYIPIPIQTFNQGGYKGIPQIQVIAQHTHTFRPHHGFPTEVILGPGGYDNVYMGQNDNAEINHNHKNKKNRHKGELNQSQKIVLAGDDSLKNEMPVTAIVEEHLVDPTKQTIVVEEIMKPETTIATQTASGEDMMGVTVSGDDKLGGAEVRSVDGRQHIVVPRHLFPIFGASSLVEVANNGRFLLKTGRDLKVADHEAGHIEEPALDVVVNIQEQESSKKDEAKSESDHSIIKKDEVSADVKPELASPKPDPLPPSEDAKPESIEKTLPEKIPIRPEQLQDIPVTIVHEEPLAQKTIQAEKSGRSVDHSGHKPVLRSEIVHEKPNGHFIVKSGVAPAVESKSNTQASHHTDDKLSDSEIKDVKVTPIENSRAL